MRDHRYDPQDRERYSRQILFAGIGEQGQQHLLDARVAVAGCGALGSFQAGALARAGIGFLRIIDRDYVELSNLQRQWLFDECDVEQGLPKAVAAARKIAAINADVRVEPVVADLTPSNVEDLLGGVDLILDGTDNFETRYLINDFAVERGVPWIYGAAVGSYGIAMPVIPGQNGVFALHLSRSAGGRAADLRDGGGVGHRDRADRELAGERGDQNSVRRGAGAQDYDRGCLERRDPAGGAARPGCGLSRLRAARVPVSGWRAPCAGEPVRPERGADPRTGAPVGAARSGGSAGAAGAGSRQRIRAPF